MRQNLTTLTLVLLLAAPASRSQSSTPPNGPPPTPSALNGNWLLIGNRALNQFPQVSFLLSLDGTHLEASGMRNFQCSRGTRKSAGGGTFGLRGELAPDGSFTLTPPALVNPATFQMTITGHAPAAGETTWRGTYHFAEVLSSCSAEESGEFTARALPLFQGTYSGDTFNSREPSSKVGLSVTVTQNAVRSYARPDGSAHFYLPLTASIDAKGFRCFSHGKAEGDVYNTLNGDGSFIEFHMDDGSKLRLVTTFTDETGQAISGIVTVLSGGCKGQVFMNTTLTRQ